MIQIKHWKAIKMMKPDVAYKLPKKMKKRRQLDALVDNGKLPRNRKNSASGQDLLNLHSDSESSDVDEYINHSGYRRK